MSDSNKPTKINKPALPENYPAWLADVKQRILQRQQRAVLAVNTQLVSLYWQIGHDILQRQSKQGWGSKVVDQLSHDLKQAFPEMKGFSARNLKYMRKFASLWPEFARQPVIVQHSAAQLPWFHICTVMDKVKGTLRDSSKPIGISEYQLEQALPKDLEDKLPSIESIEKELALEGKH